MKQRADRAGVIILDDETIPINKKKSKKKDSIEREEIKFLSLKDLVGQGGVVGMDSGAVNLEYAVPPVAMNKLYVLYKEDETISGAIDKTANIASSEPIEFKGGTDAQIARAQATLKMTFLMLDQTDEGVIVRKKLPQNEFFKYLFTDKMIYNNAYFEVKRSLDGTEMAFIYKDPRCIRVLKDHTGFVEVKGIKKYFYNNYTPDRRERNFLRLHYKKGLMKEGETIPALYKRELVQVRGYGNEYYGMSMLYCVGTSSLMQGRSKELPVSLLGNGMINTPIITFSGTSVSKDNKEEIKAKMKAEAVGHTKSGTPIIIYSATPGSKVEVAGMPRHEFDLDQVKTMYKLGESNVIKRFGIPPEKLSLLEHSNKATITEADQIMIEEVVNPIQSLFEFQMNIIFQEDMGLPLEFKFKEKAYNIEKLAKISRTVKGLTVNEIRTKVLNVEASEDPAADDILVPVSERAIGDESTVSSAKDREKTLKDEIKTLLEIRKTYEQKDN